MSRVTGQWGSRIATALAALALVGGVAAAPAGPASAIEAAGVHGLMVFEGSGVVTATWTGGLVPTLRHPRSAHDSPRDGVAYLYFTCSLLYGWGTPTTATQTTTGHQCSFYSLDTSRSWGVEVEAFLSYEGEPYGPPEAAFGAPIKPATGTTGTRAVHSIVCRKGTALRAVQGVNPHCPAGWRRVG